MTIFARLLRGSAAAQRLLLSARHPHRHVPRAPRGGGARGRPGDGSGREARRREAPRSRSLLGRHRPVEGCRRIQVRREPGRPGLRQPGGNPVVHGAETYAIYWDPQDFYHGDWQELIDGFLSRPAATAGCSRTSSPWRASTPTVTNVPAAVPVELPRRLHRHLPYPENGCTDPHPAGIRRSAHRRHHRMPDATRRCEHELERFMPNTACRGHGRGLLHPHASRRGCASTQAATHCSDYTLRKRNSKKNKKQRQLRKQLLQLPRRHQPDAGDDANTILYAAIPWTAGARRRPPDSGTTTPGYDCQDGGFEPRPNRRRSRGKAKRSDENAEAERRIRTKKAKKKAKNRKPETAPEGPHIQEPNQDGRSAPTATTTTGLADLIVNQIADEQQNIVTNPLLNAWQDAEGNEVTDECRNFFAAASSGASGADPNTLARATSATRLLGEGQLLHQQRLRPRRASSPTRACHA